MAPKPAPAPTTGKRKRDGPPNTLDSASPTTSIQIVTGSYERVLHGLTATFPSTSTSNSSAPSSTTFTDTFLFHAHSSSISSLAISPASDPTPTQPLRKRILATGSTDERINLYHIASTAPSPTSLQPAPLPFVANTPSLTGTGTTTNRELGSLLHHASTVTSLAFPTPSKLLSASLDNTIAIARTSDWTVLSTLKAPAPKALNRPSGDTAPPGSGPAGITSLAVHPSAKLAVSVGMGERSMRLWNLVTGKRAGVLTFERGVLSAVGEGRVRGGEGRVVVWRDDGEEFAVGFERGVVVFGLDCEVRGAIKVDGSKVCQVRLVPGQGVLAVSTEDGRVLVYDTNVKNAVKGEVLKEGKKFGKDAAPPPPMCKMLGQVGTSSRGSRVKDFEIFKTMEEAFVLVTGTSDGAVRLWTIDQAELLSEDCTIATSTSDTTAIPETDGKTASPSIRQIGTLLATHETGRRITCLTGFVMDRPGDAAKYAGRSKKVKAHDRGDEDGGVEIGGEEEPDISADSDGEGEEFGGFDE